MKLLTLSSLSMFSLFALRGSSELALDCNKPLIKCNLRKNEINCFDVNAEIKNISIMAIKSTRALDASSTDDFLDHDRSNYENNLRKVVFSILKDPAYRDIFKQKELKFLVTDNSDYKNNPHYELGSIFVYFEDIDNEKHLRKSLLDIISEQNHYAKFKCN